MRASYLPGGIHKSGVNSKIELTLEGMDLQRMQALVDRVYQDFLAQLQANGVELVPYVDFAAHPSFAECRAEGRPALHGDSRGENLCGFVSLRRGLWFDQAEALGDQGAFGWGNGRRAGDFALTKRPSSSTPCWWWALRKQPAPATRACLACAI